MRVTLTLREAFTQTIAMFLDAYRELNSKKLFWITMILSAIVVLAFAAVGFDTKGFSIFWKHFDSPFLNTTLLSKAQLYKNLFLSLGVQWWLGYFAIILALVSTAPLFPDFLSGGAIDLYLARPLGRWRLFLTKYAVGLLFVGIQVLVFCVASFFVIGVRGGVWVPGVFLAVPVVVLMFSYLWSICSLIGTITRSTIASLLLTFLAWFAIFGVHSAEILLLTFSVGSAVEQREIDRDIGIAESNIERLSKLPAATRPTTSSTQSMTATQRQLDMWQRTLENSRKERAAASDPFATWHSVAYAVKWPLPKTAETTELLGRWLDRTFRGPRERTEDAEPDEETTRNFFESRRVQRLTAIEVQARLRARSATWVIGTSLVFGAAMLGLAGWFFATRDY